MSRLPFALSALVFVAGLCGLVSAQPPKETPKEVNYAGKPLSEWAKLLSNPKGEQYGAAVEAFRAMSQHSDVAIEKLFAVAVDPATNESDGQFLAVQLGGFGPVALPTLTRGLWADDKRSRQMSLVAFRRLGPDGLSAGPSLARVLADPTADIPVALQAMWSVGGRSAVPAITPLLDSRTAGVQLEAATSLVSLGGDAGAIIPVLTSGLGAKDAKILQTAAWGLEQLGPEAAPAVPAIIKELQAATPPTLPAFAVALAEIGPGAKEAVPVLTKALADVKEKSPDLQASIAVAIWRIARDPNAGNLLRASLSDKPSPLVANQLWRIDPGAETIAAFEKQLKSEDSSDAITAAGILGTRTKDAVPLLGKLLVHKEARIRALAVIALVRLGAQGKEAVASLREATKDEVPQIAFWATVALSRLEPKAETVAALAAYFGNPDGVISRDAVEALGLLGTVAKPAAAKLTLTLSDRDPRVRLAAAVALWKIEQHPLALPTVVELLRSEERQMREQAAVELGVTFGVEGKSAISALVKRLFDPFSAVRSAAAEAIGRVGPGASAAAPALVAVLESEEPAVVHSAACEALGLIDPLDKEGAAAVLKKKLDHYDALVRVHSALALHRLTGDKAGEKVAERLLGNRTYQVRITAAEVLWGMKKDERAMSLLVRTLEESNLDGSGSENERYMAVRALGRIGVAAKSAVPELVKLLTHHDTALATAAATALKLINPETAKKPDGK